MNEHLVKELIETMKAQTKAISNLAQSNEGLVAVIYDSLLSEEDDLPAQTYLNGKPRG